MSKVAAGKSEIKVSLTVHCLPPPPSPQAPTAAIPAPAPAPIEATQPQATQGRGRPSATTVQLDRVQSALNDESSRRDYSMSLRARWTCTDQTCPNYPKVCYWLAAGNPQRNHYPLYSDLVVAWTKDIREDLATAESPSILTFYRMRTARDQRDGRGASNSSGAFFL